MEGKDQHGMLRNVIWCGWNVEYKRGVSGNEAGEKIRTIQRGPLDCARIWTPVGTCVSWKDFK